MFDKDTWEFINTFAPWLAALGTFAAVLTSLYLARETRIRIKIRAEVSYIVTRGDPSGHRPECLSFRITNTGIRETTISQLYWDIGLFKKKHYLWLVPENSYSSPLPVRLKDGEDASYLMPMHEFDSNLGDIGRNLLSGWLGPIKAHFIYACVGTSTGSHFKKRVGPDLRKRFLNAAKKTKNKTE